MNLTYKIINYENELRLFVDLININMSPVSEAIRLEIKDKYPDFNLVLNYDESASLDYKIKVEREFFEFKKFNPIKKKHYSVYVSKIVKQLYDKDLVIEVDDLPNSYETFISVLLNVHALDGWKLDRIINKSNIIFMKTVDD